ncbi:hypothetical protein PPACK8108_LOCUS16192 [Phakopsora pachyrhizi]|uniref:Uncharacterized protein n=1 Tax=Phakopsora pachyrhizi TaxID=170000 RepID=A0AAV0B7G7_PHAPC|nr:hypothetical protein PPACK8108_LOCUS16192 [Phakopsora pachyrhizi]
MYSTDKDKGLAVDLDCVLPFAPFPENGCEIDGLDDCSELKRRVMLSNQMRPMGEVKKKKWFSELWGENLCLAGAVTGWTRGTSLMSGNNLIAEQVESHGLKKFSAKEMAFNILGLMHPLLFDVGQSVEANVIHQMVKVSPPVNFTLPMLKLRESFDNFMIDALCQMIDLDKVIVIAGCTELEPFGSLRTQWQMEAKGEFSIKGLLELGSITGLIKFVDRKMKNGKQYVEQVDAKTEDPVYHYQVKPKDKAQILAHTGVWLIEPEMLSLP